MRVTVFWAAAALQEAQNGDLEYLLAHTSNLTWLHCVFTRR